MTGTEFVLTPSLFEGWSTSVEEAKALEKQMILSDTPIHREQMTNNVIFIDPLDPKSLAPLLRVNSCSELGGVFESK
jgi:hypothetical protein